MPEPIPAPTPADLVRNATADLAVCEAATPGPWEACPYLDASEVSGPDMSDACWKPEDARFVAASRTALPSWIRRAAAAEARVLELEAGMEALRNRDEWLD